MFFSVASTEAYFSSYLVFWCGDALLRSRYMLSYYNRKKLCPMLRISVLRAGKGLVRGGSVYVYMREMTGYDFRQKKGCGKISLYHSLLGTAYSFMGFRSLSSQMRMVAACAPVISAISSRCIPLRSRAIKVYPLSRTN